MNTYLRHILRKYPDTYPGRAVRDMIWMYPGIYPGMTVGHTLWIYPDMTTIIMMWCPGTPEYLRITY